MWQADVLSHSFDANHHENILLVIDINNSRVWMRRVLNGFDVAETFRGIFEEGHNIDIKKLHTDRDIKFVNTAVASVLKRFNIQHVLLPIRNIEHVYRACLRLYLNSEHTHNNIMYFLLPPLQFDV